MLNMCLHYEQMDGCSWCNSFACPNMCIGYMDSYHMMHNFSLEHQGIWYAPKIPHQTRVSRALSLTRYVGCWHQTSHQIGNSKSTQIMSNSSYIHQTCLVLCLMCALQSLEMHLTCAVLVQTVHRTLFDVLKIYYWRR